MDVTRHLDPELAALIEGMPVPDADDDFVAMVRAFGAQMVDLPGVEQSDFEVPGRTGVTARVYRPTGVTGILPAMVWAHGGGYVFGTRDMADPLFGRICPELGMIGVSVDYRLAPEVPFPGPLEDCYGTLQWVHSEADELGIDRMRTGVGGLSAGGGLAAAIALLARERGQLDVAFQLLEGPMIDDRQITASSQLDGLHLWSRESSGYGWKAYLGDRYGTEDVPETAAPARAADLSGLPPALVIVGSHDGFLDENVDYAMRLVHADVPTDLHVIAGACHGYQTFNESALTGRANALVDDWLSRQISA